MTESRLRVAIVGCGLIGQKRPKALVGRAHLSVCCDLNPERAQVLAKAFPGALAITDWQTAVARPEVDAVCVCTTHNQLAPGATLAASHAKHVLIEKPGAARAAELTSLREAARNTGVLLRVGFNHRYHRSFRKAREIFESGALSDLLDIRARYGHGRRLGYDKKSRAVPELSGGGEAIDQLHAPDRSHPLVLG